MASLPLASLANRGRGILSSSTVIHVLRLVHYGYSGNLPARPTARGAARRYSSRSKSLHSTPTSTSLSLPARRHGSSAPAMQQDPDEQPDTHHPDEPPELLRETDHHHDHKTGVDLSDLYEPAEPLPLTPSSPLGHTSDPPEDLFRSISSEALRIRDPESQLSLEFVRRVWSADVPALPNPEDPQNANSKLKLSVVRSRASTLTGKGKTKKETAHDVLGERIRSGEIDGIESLRQHLDRPTLLASRSTLEQVLILLNRSGSFEDWAWLAMEVNEMLSQLESMDNGIYDHGIPPVAHALIGYALLQDLGDTTFEIREQRQVLARLQVEKSFRFRAALPKDILPSFSFEHSLRGSILAHLLDWEAAQREFHVAIKKNMSSYEDFDYPVSDGICLEQYSAVLEHHRRIDDLPTIALFQYRELLPLFQKNQEHQTRAALFLDIFIQAFLRIPNPVKWFEAKLASSPTTRTRRLGAMLFIGWSYARTVEEAEDAVRLFNRLRTAEIPISSYHLVRLCCKLDDLNYPDIASSTYFRFLRDKPQLSHTSLSSMTSLFLKNNRVKDAANTLRSIVKRHHPNTFELRQLAVYHAERGNIKQTVDSLREFVGKSALVQTENLELLQRAYINANDPLGARRLLEKLSSVDPTNIRYWNRQLWFHARRGDVAAAIQLFDEIVASANPPDTDTYAALISLFGRQRDSPSVNRVVEAALSANIVPDAGFCAAILNADIKAGDYRSAAARWAALPETLQYDNRIMASIMKAFVYLSAPVSTVMRLFRRLESPAMDQYSLALLSLVDHLELDEARVFIEKMDCDHEYDRSKPKPNIYTFSMLMYGYLGTGQNEAAREVYNEISFRRLVPTSVTYAMIVKSFLRSSDRTTALDQAHEFAMTILKKSEEGVLPEQGAERAEINTKLFSPLITAAGKLAKSEMAQAYFDLATNDRPPDLRLYTPLMDAYRRSGDVEQVMTIWEKIFDLANEMVQPLESTTGTTHALNPRLQLRSNLLCIPLSIVIDSLSSQQRLEDIQRVWKSVRDAGFAYDGPNYQHLAVAFTRCGHLEGAFYVVERILLRRWDDIRRRQHRIIREREELLKGDIEPRTVDQLLKEDQERRYQAEPFNDLDGQMFTLPEDLHQELNPVDPASVEASNDPPIQPNLGAHRRKGLRRNNLEEIPDASQDPEESEQVEEELEDTKEDTSRLVSHMLTTWRPGDLSWKPSVLTRRILSAAFGQLQAQRRAIQVAMEPAAREMDEEGVLSDPEDPKEVEERRQSMSRPHIVTLPAFNDAAVLNYRGKRYATTPAAIIYRLTTKYPRVLDLIGIHRAKRDKKWLKRHHAYTQKVLELAARRRHQLKVNEKRRLRRDHRNKPNYELYEYEEARAKKLDDWAQERATLTMPTRGRIPLPEFAKRPNTAPMAYVSDEERGRWNVWLKRREIERAKRQKAEAEELAEKERLKEEARMRRERRKEMVEKLRVIADVENVQLALRDAQEKGFATGFGLKTGPTEAVGPLSRAKEGEDEDEDPDEGDI